jgi:hypothetical protein
MKKTAEIEKVLSIWSQGVNGTRSPLAARAVFRSSRVNDK